MVRESYQWKKFKSNKLAIGCVVFLIAIYLVSFIGPLILDDPFNVYDPKNRYNPPSRDHLFGTDRQGRDVLTMTIYGGRMTLTVGLVAVAIAVAIGLVYGAIMGYFGGWIDNLMMQGTMIVSSIPSIPLIVIVMGIFGRNIYLVMVLEGLLLWTGISIITRGQFMTFKEREFVEAARAYGASTSRIIFRHILPNTLAPIWVNVSFLMGSAIVLESTLSYLGLGVPFDVTSWGRMLVLGKDVMSDAPWIFLPSAILLFLTSFSFIVLGETMRDVFDPKFRSVRSISIEKMVDKIDDIDKTDDGKDR